MTQTKDIFMYALTGIIVLAVVLIIILLIFYPVPDASADTIKNVLIMLAGAVLVCYNYWFGSSKSSADKTEALTRISETPKS